MQDLRALLVGSAAEDGLKSALEVINSLELKRFDFIGTEECGYVLTNNGQNKVSKLNSFIKLEKEKFDGIKSPLETMMYFSEKQLEIKVAIENKLTEHKESREAAIAEAGKSGLELPDIFKEGGNEGT